jgi:hypothetical protein
MTVPLTFARARIYEELFTGKGKTIAFVPVLPDGRIPGILGALGIAVANENGYTPIPLGWARYATFDSAADHADQLNREVLALSGDDEFRIIASTMGGMRYKA